TSPSSSTTSAGSHSRLSRRCGAMHRSYDTASSRRGVLKRVDRDADVAEALVAGLALDDERAGVADGFECIEEAPRADLPGAERDLGAPLHPRLIREDRVFHVHVSDVPAEDADRVDGV